MRIALRVGSSRRSAALVAQRRSVVLSREESGDGLWRPGLELLVWADADCLYLVPESAYAAVARACREAGECFPVRQGRLAKDLLEEQLTECDPDRHTRTVRIAGQTRRVWALRRKAVEDLLGHDFATPLPSITGITGDEE